MVILALSNFNVFCNNAYFRQSLISITCFSLSFEINNTNLHVYFVHIKSVWLNNLSINNYIINVN